MPIATARRAATLLLVVLGLSVVVSSFAAPAQAATVSDKLVLTWGEEGDRLLVTGTGYRARDLVEVRLADSNLRQTRADDNGRVEVSVPEELITAGQSGASIVLAGRAASGRARVLISAVPPRASAHGPADLLPRALAGLAIAALPLGLWLRHRNRPRTPRAPRGYRRRHAA